VHVSYGKSDVLEQRLLNNELDAAILINFKQRRLFDVFSFSIEQEILVTSPLYLDRFGAIKDYERVLNASIIDMSPDFDCFRPWLAKNRKGLLPRLARRTPALIIESHQGMRDVVKSGFGIAMLPKHLIHDDWKQGTLVQLLKQSKPTEVGIELAIRKKRTDKLVNTLFVQHLLGDTNAR
jgi:DNA-binding transcriptional LysR family regulator